MEEVLDLLGLTELAGRPIDTLDLGHARLVELGRAMMGTPRLLMLDEPSSGLDAEDTARLSRILGETRRSTGVAVVLVEHDLALVESAVDRLYVLNFGKVLASGGVTRSWPIPRSGAPTWGARHDVDRVARRRRRRRWRPSRSWSSAGVGASYGPYEALFDVSLTVRAGHALALVGANGAGKSTVARVVSGLVPTTAGDDPVRRPGHHGRPAYEIARIGPVPAHRGTLGLRLPDRRGEPHAVLPACPRPQGAWPDALARAYEAFPRLGERRTQSAGTLSGGEQRMLALARVLVLDQRLLVVDELSFGLAPVVVDEVYAALERVLAAGTSLLLIEQHVDRALVLADDVVVLSKGRVVYDGPVAGVEGRLGDLVLGRPDWRRRPVDAG